MKPTHKSGTFGAALPALFGGQAHDSLAKAASTVQRLIRGRMETRGGSDTMREPAHWSDFLPGAAALANLDPMMSMPGRAAPDGAVTGLREVEPAQRRVPPPPVTPPSKPRFLSGSFVNEAGTRPYRLFVPSGYRPGVPIPLVVMLHGCTQSPDDFAIGTRMNEAAERETMLVIYPGQTRSANIQKCWNWFREDQQRRNMGEPSLIAGITFDVVSHYAVDPRRIYVAGLSAGGAAASIMGDTYPDLFAAVGVHSGLACGAARNLSSAMTAMRGGPLPVFRSDAAALDPERRIVPTIVFHGDHDATVHPRNAEQVVAQSAGSTKLSRQTRTVHVEKGHDYDVTTAVDADGSTVIEKWMVHGGGHAWFGGSPDGSYTDPHGPDATAEMLRFFLAHPRPLAAGNTGADPG